MPTGLTITSPTSTWRLCEVRQQRPMVVRRNVRTRRLRGRLWRGNLPRHRGHTPRPHPAKGEMTVIALVQRLDQRIAGGSKRRGDLRVSDSGPARDVDRPPEQMKAVRNAADRMIVRDGAEGAGDHAEPGRDPLGGGGHMVEHAARTGARTHGTDAGRPMRRRRQRRRAHRRENTKATPPQPDLPRPSAVRRNRASSGRFLSQGHEAEVSGDGTRTTAQSLEQISRAFHFR